MTAGRTPTPARAWMLLALLTLGYVFSAADRAIISLLVEPIKADLAFSDTQIGLLQGFAFLLFYSVAGIPAGMLVDRLSRVKLLGVALAAWSIMTAICGMARTFTHLFLARAGVGVGEAFLSPAALSLIGDVIPRRRHGLAIGVYVGGSLVGSSIAVGFGGLLYGWLAARGPTRLPLLGVLEPWQMTFVLVGLPGLLVAAAFFLVTEPRRDVAGAAEGGGLRAFYRDHWRFILFHHGANGFTNLLAGGVTSWAASYLIRTFGSDVASVGPLLGFAFLGGGMAGMIGGGLLSDGLLRYGGHTRLWLCAGSAAFGALAALPLASVHDVRTGALLIGLIVMCGSVPYSVAIAALQQITPDRIRGTVAAVYYFAISIVGSVGPSAVAFVTDRVLHDPARLDEALVMIVAGGFLVSMLLYLLAVRPYRVDARRAAAAGTLGETGSEVRAFTEKGTDNPFAS